MYPYTHTHTHTWFVRALLGKCCGIYYCILYSYFQVLKHIQRVLENAMSHASLISPAKQTKSKCFFSHIIFTQIISKKHRNLACIHFGVYSLIAVLLIHLFNSLTQIENVLITFLKVMLIFLPLHFRFFLVIFPLSFLNTLSKSKITLSKSNSNLSSNFECQFDLLS